VPGEWLVVVTAIGRYVAICRPLEARRIASGPRNTRIAVAGAFLGSALIELPTAWTYSISRFDCPETYYVLDHLPAAKHCPGEIPLSTPAIGLPLFFAG